MLEVQIFVSCPNDVSREKKSVRDACNQVNETFRKRQIAIRFACRDYGLLSLSIGSRVQEVINREITNYDVYLGILHMRFGTPTGSFNPDTNQEYESGTEEEFDLAYRRYKAGEKPTRIFFFFKQQIGCESSEQSKQALKVHVFREWLEKEHCGIHHFKEGEFDGRILNLLYDLGLELQFAMQLPAKEAVLNKQSFDKTTLKELIKQHLAPLKPCRYYIRRSIRLFKHQDDPEKSLFPGEEIKTIYLQDALLTTRRLVLLGNAGSGKSVELEQLAFYYQRPDTPFIAFYKKFNTYVDQDIQDFVPTGWREVVPDLLLILLDGLDEVQPLYFSTAIRKITAFSEQNPELRIVISCRTNFYELPRHRFSGTLMGFDVYYLEDILNEQILEHAIKELGINGNAFLQEVHQQGLTDLIRKPFYLEIILKYFIKNKSLKSDRSDLILQSILSSIEMDREHFRSDLTKNPIEIIALFEKLAFIMELCGKNFLLEDELETALPNRVDRDEVKKLSLFIKDLAKEQWMFEHNNIQEFLAARVLARQSNRNLLKIITFPPSQNKLKPTWVNTISFFISLGDQKRTEGLVRWLLKIDPEVIVRFQPDRVDALLRLRVFKQIFNFYKQKNVWLNSNKFSSWELARFASSKDAILFLIREIKKRNNSKITRLNAISTIDNFELERFDPSLKQQIKDVLLHVLKTEQEDTYMIYSILYAMARLRITDNGTVEYFVEKFGNRSNQYIRAGLYKLINEAALVNEHVDVYLNGLTIGKYNESDPSRESVSLADESWLLEKGLARINKPTALKKAFELFSTIGEEQQIVIYEKDKIFSRWIENAILVYPDDNTLFSVIVNLFRSCKQYYNDLNTKLIVSFFENIGKKWHVFQLIWSDTSMEPYQRQFLLQSLVDAKMIDKFCEGYKARDFTNDDLAQLYQLSFWEFQSGKLREEDLAEFENQIEQLTGNKLERPVIPDWTTINNEKEAKSFNLLFDKSLMLQELKTIFVKLGKVELTYDDVWPPRMEQHRVLDGITPAALEVLRDFTPKTGAVTYDKVLSWVEQEDHYLKYQIKIIYRKLHNSCKTWELTDQQKKLIVDWTLKTAASVDITSSVYSKTDGQTSVSVSGETKLVWFFTERFQINLPEEKLLDFTCYFDFEKKNTKEDITITTLESFVDKEKLRKRVLQNLSSHISIVNVWQSNAVYAITNRVSEAYPYIIRALKNRSVRDYYRWPVLDLYYKASNNDEALQDILQSIGNDGLRWPIVKYMLEKPAMHRYVKGYLRKLLRKTDEVLDDRVQAARYLMQLQDRKGLDFAVEWILAQQNSVDNYREVLPTLSHQKNKEAVPVLISVLEAAKVRGSNGDGFNNLESLVNDALHNIAIQSEENLQAVKRALTFFIDENKNRFADLNFLHFNVRQMEEQFYLNQSQYINIVQATAEFEKLEKKK